MTITQPRAAAARFLREEEAGARRALRRASLTWWTASLSGEPRDYERMEHAERAVNRHYARKTAYQRVKRLASADDIDPVTRRRLHLLELDYQAKQAPVEMLDRITAAEATVQETYSTFRAEFEGRLVTDNELEDLLRTTRDERRAQAAWQARKQIGGVVANDLRRLAELRNTAARA